MNNIQELLKIQNKEFLWNVLYKNNVFDTIQDSKIREIKGIFEETIINSIDYIKKNNLQNNNLLDLNKIIVKNLNSNIIAYKSQILSSIDSKDIYKKTKFDGLQQEFEKQKETMNNALNLEKPKTIDFSDKNDEPIDNNIMLLKIQEMEKERNINFLNNENNKDNQNNEIELNIENLQLEEKKQQQQQQQEQEQTIQENSVPKIKISNIEDLLQNDLNIENLDVNKEELYKQKYEESRKSFFQKRDSRINITNIDEVLRRDNSHEFIANHNIKNVSINQMLTTILHNQKLIMEKLEINN
jgi:hypothetical protein